MEHDIVRKLRAEVERGISTESQVVYIMVKIRKLFDLDKQRAALAYSTLRLYCDWAVHVELGGPQAQNIVRMADAFYPKLLKGEVTEQEKYDFRSAFSLNRFREELNQFLIDQRIRPLSEPEWNSFLACFLNTIEDCPLKCKAQGTTEVDEVVIIKHVEDGDRVPDGNAPPILWALCFRGKLRFPVGANFALSEETVEALNHFTSIHTG